MCHMHSFELPCKVYSRARTSSMNCMTLRTSACMILCLELPSEMTAQMLMSQPNRKHADYHADWKCAESSRAKIIVLHRALVVSKRDLIASLKRQLSDSKARWNNCHMHMTLLASSSMILCFRRARKNKQITRKKWKYTYAHTCTMFIAHHFAYTSVCS